MTFTSWVDCLIHFMEEVMHLGIQVLINMHTLKISLSTGSAPKRSHLYGIGVLIRHAMLEKPVQMISLLIHALQVSHGEGQKRAYRLYAKIADFLVKR